MQQVLAQEGRRNKIKAKSGVCSWRIVRLPTRLPLSERAARVASSGVVWDAEMVLGARMRFVEWRITMHNPKDQRFGTPYVIAVDG